MEPRQDVSVVRFHDILLESYDSVSRGRNNDVSMIRHQDVSVQRIHDVPLVPLRPKDVSCKSQMKHPLTYLWYVSTKPASHVVARVTFSFG